eukprot:805285-Prymnesium_polylepis.2
MDRMRILSDRRADRQDAREPPGLLLIPLNFKPSALPISTAYERLVLFSVGKALMILSNAAANSSRVIGALERPWSLPSTFLTQADTSVILSLASRTNTLRFCPSTVTRYPRSSVIRSRLDAQIEAKVRLARSG